MRVIGAENPAALGLVSRVHPTRSNRGKCPKLQARGKHRLDTYSTPQLKAAEVGER